MVMELLRTSFAHQTPSLSHHHRSHHHRSLESSSPHSVHPGRQGPALDGTGTFSVIGNLDAGEPQPRQQQASGISGISIS